MLCVNKRCWYFWLWYFTKRNRFRYSKSIRVDFYISAVSPPAPLRKDFSRQFDWWVLFLHQVQWIKKKKEKKEKPKSLSNHSLHRGASLFLKKVLDQRFAELSPRKRKPIHPPCCRTSTILIFDLFLGSLSVGRLCVCAAEPCDSDL